jgi:phage terminase large subunit GpA-like protein
MSNALNSLFREIARQWKPPPKWKVSQWADSTRKLSSEASAEPGQWDTVRAEYQREIMDAVNDPATERVVIMSSAQVGKTEVLNNVVGYYIDYDPCPMLMLQPTLEMGETWSKDRFDPMARDTPEIGRRIAGGKARDKKSTILHKTFVGGHLTVAGANSPASLASRPIRVVLADEVDRYPASAGNEGDPLNLAIKRTSTFWNRKILAVSTPTLKGFSRIEAAFEETDKRRFHINCPHCQTEHVLMWANVVWGKDTPADGDPEKAVFRCPACDGYYNDVQKNAAVKKGRWIATAAFKGRAGFHIWEAYSPWRRLAEIVRDFLDAKDDPEKLQVWVNTSLGETWEGSGDALRDTDLMNRLPFKQDEHDVPRLGLLLTAGIDTQPDRLEVEVVAWGAGEQSWSVDYHVIHGDPDIPEGTAGSPWTELTDYLRKRWRHESGSEITVGWTCIDSGGHNTQAVYGYAKRHKGSRVFAIKGRGGAGLPIIGAPNRKRTGKVKRPVDVHIVGVDSAKMTVLNRFKLDTPGPGFCHFPVGRDPEWFRQLCAEKLVTRFVKGFPVREFHKVGGARNEALDCRVYAFAALVLAAPQWEKLAFRMKKRTEQQPTKPAEPVEPEDTQPTPQDAPEAEPQTQPERPQSRKPARRRRKSFVTSW